MDVFGYVAILFGNSAFNFHTVFGTDIFGYAVGIILPVVNVLLVKIAQAEIQFGYIYFAVAHIHMVQFHIALLPAAVVGQPFVFGAGGTQFAGGFPSISVTVFGSHRLVSVYPVHAVNYFFGIEVAHHHFSVYAAVKVKGDIRVVGGFFNIISRAAYVLVRCNDDLNVSVFFRRVFRQSLNQCYNNGNPGFIVGG